MNYNYIIVEDNLGAVANLQTALKSHKNLVEFGVAHNLNDGIKLALSKRPHVIFLDVELGNDNGFDLIKEIRQFTGELPFVIMTTDYDAYARKAVNSDVLYFLDKPIDLDELEIALTKVERKFLDLQKHITVKNTDGHFFMKLENILYVEASDSYSYIYRTDSDKMIVSKTLKSIESILPPQFVRVHKKYIINKTFVHMMNTTKKVIKLKNPFNTEEPFIEIPIGEIYLEKAKNTLLTIV